MAIYSIESAMKNYNVRNNNIKALEKKILRKEEFVGVIIYYEFDFKTVDYSMIYTDEKSYREEVKKCLEIDYPFKHSLIKDRSKQIERSLI